MTPELYSLTFITLVTALMWIPYILDRMRVRGVMATLGNPRDDAPPQSAWAERAKRAHANAVENLVVFAALILVAQLIGVSNSVTTTAASVYVWARLAHFVVFTAGLPVIRTLCFLVGFGCQVAVGSQLLSAPSNSGDTRPNPISSLGCPVDSAPC